MKHAAKLVFIACVGLASFIIGRGTAESPVSVEFIKVAEYNKEAAIVHMMSGRELLVRDVTIRP